MIQDICQHERSAGQPWCQSERLQVWAHCVVAVTALPACCFKARYRFHFKVSGEQIIAGMAFLITGLQEMPDMQPLPHHPTLHIHLSQDDSIYFASIGGGG